MRKQIKHRAPSLKRPKKEFPYTGLSVLRQIRGIIRGEIRCTDVSARYRALKAQGAHADRLTAIDDLLGHHGVEVILDRHGDVVATYSNSGDTYAPTIMRVAGNYRISSWGDFVEMYERHHAPLP